MSEPEQELRQRIMDALAERTVRNGGVVTRAELGDLDIGQGQTRRLIDPGGAGIWNPRDLAGTLTILSSPDGPYNDKEVEGGLLRYDYRAGSDAGQNTKLRLAMDLGLPLILLRKIKPGIHVPIFPVYVTYDDQASRQFLIALDESLGSSLTRFTHRHPSAGTRKGWSGSDCISPSFELVSSRLTRVGARSATSSTPNCSTHRTSSKIVPVMVFLSSATA